MDGELTLSWWRPESQPDLRSSFEQRMALKRASRNDSDGQHTFLLQSWSDQSFHQAIIQRVNLDVLSRQCYDTRSYDTLLSLFDTSCPAAQLPRKGEYFSFSSHPLKPSGLSSEELRDEISETLNSFRRWCIWWCPRSWWQHCEYSGLESRIIQNNPETKTHNQEEPVPINFFFAILVILVMVEASTLQHNIQRSSGDRDAEVK